MRKILVVLALVAGTLVAGTCVRLMRQRAMDYDEIAHAHAVWLTAAGDVPFYDFFENHPPFPWLVLAPLARGQADGDALVLHLRVSSFAGQLVFLALLAANMRRGREDLDPLWIAVALLTMLAREWNIGYLIECRPDVWAAAALLAGILVARTEAVRPFVRYGSFGLLAVASLLWSPKLIALAGLFGLLETMRNRRPVGVAAAMLAGGALAFAIGVTALYLAGIHPADAYAATIGYNSAFGRHGGWGPGLWEKIASQWTLAGIAAGGFVCWLIALARRQVRANSFELAVAGFLIAQLVLVPFPYKQYFAPWLLFAAVFIPFYSLLIDRMRLLRAVALPVGLVLLCVQAASVFLAAGGGDGFARTGEYWRFMKGASGGHGRIVAPIAWHPITARDAMYAVTGTNGPNVGYGPEAILKDLDHPRFSPRLTFAHYLRELETHRPEVIVPGRGADTLFPEQQRAVETYLARHPGLYSRRVVGWEVVFVKTKRPDPRVRPES